MKATRQGALSQSQGGWYFFAGISQVESFDVILILDLSRTQLQIINLFQEMKKEQLRQKISIETI
jgi:hypothetical protein